MENSLGIENTLNVRSEISHKVSQKMVGQNGITRCRKKWDPAYFC